MERTYHYFCFTCRSPCNITHIDLGVGPGEANGQRFNDSFPVPVSDCCEAAIIDSNDKVLTDPTRLRKSCIN